MNARPSALALLAAMTLLVCHGSALSQSNDRPTLRERLQQRAEQRRRSADDDAPLTAGTHTLSIGQGGEARPVIVHVPENLDLSRPVPLVLALHGGGGHAEQMAEHYGLVDKADRAGFVVAFPNGYSPRPRQRFATWNAGRCCGDARDRQVDDVGFLRTVVEQLKRRLPVDPARVFATGMSNGGMMSHRLACEAADVFRAVASVAGTDNTTACTPSRPISVLHIHAKDDTHVLYMGGAGEDAFRDVSKVTDFTSVPETIARWTRRDACTGAPQTLWQRPGARCEATTGCAGGVSVQLCSTDDGGHSWPGAEASRPGKAPPSKALDANDVIWDFFVSASPR